jgi:hypothetical protein
MTSRRAIREVIETTDLRVVARRLLGEPKRTSAQVDFYNCPSPQHRDSDPSFAVYSSNYYCFGCQIYGRLPDLLHLMGIINLQGQWFNSMLDFLGQHATEPSSIVYKSKPQNVTVPQINQKLTSIYSRNLHLGKGYLRERGLWPPPEYLRLGVTFRDFPVADTKLSVMYIAIPYLWHGQTWGIKLRRNDRWLSENQGLYDKDETFILERKEAPYQPNRVPANILDKLFPRYLSVTNSDFGIYNADILDNTMSYIFVTEGELDAIMLLKLGYNAVAFKPHKANGLMTRLPHLFRNVENIVIIADADEPGRKYAEKIKQALGDNCFIVEPPVGKDVCEAVNDWGQTYWLDVAMEIAQRNEYGV